MPVVVDAVVLTRVDVTVAEVEVWLAVLLAAEEEEEEGAAPEYCHCGL